MRLWSRVLAFLLVAGLAFWFTVENSGRMVTVELLWFRVRASVPVVVFGSVLAGMLAVFLVGLRADLRTRRLLQRHRAELAGGAFPAAGGAERWPRVSPPEPSGATAAEETTPRSVGQGLRVPEREVRPPAAGERPRVPGAGEAGESPGGATAEPAE